MVAVFYDEISSAFEFVSAAPPIEHSAYISLDTGQIFWTSELASMDQDLPDDIGTSDRYLSVPHKNELDLGKNLSLRFAARELADSYGRVRAIFRSKGAYRRFKELLEDKGLLDRWYQFEAREKEEALRAWCARLDRPPNRALPALLR